MIRDSFWVKGGNSCLTSSFKAGTLLAWTCAGSVLSASLGEFACVSGIGWGKTIFRIYSIKVFSICLHIYFQNNYIYIRIYIPIYIYMWITISTDQTMKEKCCAHPSLP